MQAREVRRVPRSEDLSKPGDYCYVPKRAPIVTYERKPLESPRGLVQKIRWHFFGKKYGMKQIVELQWPEYDVAILNCHNCNSPFATTKFHKILSIEPLTARLFSLRPHSPIPSLELTSAPNPSSADPRIFSSTSRTKSLEPRSGIGISIVCGACSGTALDAYGTDSTSGGCITTGT
jgi:hypothetical protein